MYHQLKTKIFNLLLTSTMRKFSQISIQWIFTMALVWQVGIFASCNQKASDKTEPEGNGIPEMTFEDRTHEFGDIMQGEKVSYTFVYKNTGNAPLIIKSVKASCGCTTPKYSKEPVQPGDEGFVEVVFDSAGRQGFQTKSVTLTTNTPEEIIEVNFTANVKLNN